MSVVRRLFALAYIAASLLFSLCGVTLLGLAVLELLSAFQVADAPGRLDAVLETIAVLTIAVAALELGQTVLEEEVLREAQMSAPTRVRRFLSRFMVVVVVSLSIEALVAVFQLLHRDPARLPQAASIALAAAAILVGWGVFVKLNRAAEELEPEGVIKAKAEDHKVS